MTDKPRPPPITARFEIVAHTYTPRASELAATSDGATLPSPFVSPSVAMLETRLVPQDASEPRPVVRTPQHAAEILHQLVGDADREHFVALYLNSQHHITHAHIVSRGVLNSAPISPREVFKGAFLANASAVIVGHNHPSGTVVPSADDEAVRRRLTTAGHILGIQLLDALIVGPTLTYYAHSNGQGVLEPPRTAPPEHSAAAEPSSGPSGTPM